MTSAAAPPPRKFPPPCWSDEEAQALISVFKQKWTSLNRGNLKSHDWDDVAASLAALFPHISPSKTAVQCHNKVEKLRRRFRSEKLRASTRPGRSSPWALYPFLQDLDTSAGPTLAEINHNSTAHFPVKSLGHRHVAAAHAPWLEEASYSKRRRSAVEKDRDDDEEEDEVVAAIRRLGEKYMEVEKRKMETAREIVMMQMDMEMKQTKAVMESQQKMLAACVAALLSDSGDNKMKKKKRRTSNAAAATEGDESS